MKSNQQSSWAQFKQNYYAFPSIQLALDLSRLPLDPAFLRRMTGPVKKAFSAMKALEAGAIANPDEKRMVGHYWLRNPAKAPNRAIRSEIEGTIRKIKRFSAAVHNGRICGAKGKFRNMLLVGIGGSALGPQFVSNALGKPGQDKIKPYFLDNTDPDGIQKVIKTIGKELSQTICIVISKSGGTKETRNGMLEAKSAYEKCGLVFADHTVAVTGQDSELDRYAKSNGWLERFPMWDWVGGRTSELSAVGLLPAAVQGIDIDLFLAGAKACDAQTRIWNLAKNPAAILALTWYKAGNGRGDKNMVVIPYKDRLELLAKYLQQLVMESIGKSLDTNNRTVNQGITVLGNKGSTDQHSYIQQLRDGLNDFFLTFIEVLKDQEGRPLLVEDQFTSGDYLSGFLLGTRQAMLENDRATLTITVDSVSEYSVGVLIALYERAVGFYATLIGINAYHQPGVESGKKAAGKVLVIQKQTIDFLRQNRNQNFTIDQIASRIAEKGESEHIFKILERLCANPLRRISKSAGKTPFSAKYAFR